MTRWLASSILLGLVAAPPSFAATTEHLVPGAESSGPRLNFRLVQEPRLGPRPIHHSGMIAQTQITDNAAIGIGLFKSSQRKPDAGEWRLEGRSPNSRKAAVRFQLKF